MKIKLLSDLHLEFGVKLQDREYFPYNGEDVLVLAGDIDSGATNTIKTLKQFHAAGYPHIVYVPGNHEYYNSDGIADFDAKLRRFSEEVDWLHFLQKDWWSPKDSKTIFIGATLWTNFHNNPLSEHAASRGINDFRRIPNFSTKQCAAFNEMDTQYLFQARKTLGELFPKYNFYIVTHFLPARVCIDPFFVANGGLLNDYFANGLDDRLLDLTPTTWLFGHTHSPCDIQHGDVRLVCNPYGYHGYESQLTFKNQCYV
jgi:predicted phosphodiesterase